MNGIVIPPFYSLLFETTKDMSKTDQLCEVYHQCVIEQDENGTPKELVIKKLFFRFPEVKDHTASEMSKHIIKSINDGSISLNKCRR